MAVTAQNLIAPFDPPMLESIAKVLADTERGLTGSQIEHKLRQCRIPDVDPTNTKWKRLGRPLVPSLDNGRLQGSNGP